MAARLIESLTTTDAFAELFSDTSVLQAMLDFEVGLARAQAHVGMVPGSAADFDCSGSAMLPVNGGRGLNTPKRVE